VTPSIPLHPSAPIGVFDSGLGGLTVVREILRRLPHERIVYVGDTAHVPYGGRPLEQVHGFAVGISRYLIESAHCKAIVMACNISSAVACDAVAELYPAMPVLGVIAPGARAAAARAAGDPIGVLATDGTVRSGAYARAIEAQRPGTPVTSIACPKFVPLVESGQTETPEAQDAAREYLSAATAPHGARVIILGCTHYPFLLPTLKRLAGPDVAFVDPAGETVRELGCRLAEHPFFACEGGHPQAGTRGGSPAGPGDGATAHIFYATGDPASFSAGAEAFLGDVAHISRRLIWREGQLEEEHGSDTH